LSDLASLDYTRRVADCNHPWSYILCYYRAGADNGAFADRDARADKGIGAYPRFHPNGNRRTQQWKFPFRVIVRSRAKVRAM
jgi:hypothetical protein